MKKQIFILLITLCLASSVFAQQTFRITTHLPKMFSDNAARDAAIILNFNQPILTDNFSEKSIVIIGDILGYYRGSTTFSNSNNTITITAENSFQAGEVIQVFVNKNIQSTNGENLTIPYSFSFSVRTGQSDLIFDLVKTINFSEVPYPVQLGTYDINQDSFLDFIVGSNRVITDPQPARMAILLSNASAGTDLTLNTINAGVSPCCFLIAPFDQDEYIDIIAIDFFVNALIFLHGTSNWTFESTKIIPFSHSPIWGDITDFDGDGNIDFIIAGQGQGMGLYKNYDDGRTEQEFFPNDGNDVRSVAWGDVNNDGIADVIAANYSPFRSVYDLAVYLGIGDGKFSTLLYSPLSFYTFYIQLRDFDSDGDLDVAALQPSYTSEETDPPGQIEILFNDGQGRFTTNQRIRPAGTSPLFMDCRDIDGDGDIDLIASNSGPSFDPDSTISIYLNNGTGNFSFAQNLSTLITPKGIRVVDFSGDGRMDIAVVTNEPPALQFYKASVSTDVLSDKPAPTEYELSLSSSPNPFRDIIIFHIQQPQQSNSELIIFDILGRVIYTENIPPGRNHKVIWNGKNLQGTSLTNGVYWAVLRNDSRSVSHKLVLIK